MALETYISAVCDRCQMRSEDFALDVFTRAQILAMLREQGWMRRRGGRTTSPGMECPRCSGETPVRSVR